MRPYYTTPHHNAPLITGTEQPAPRRGTSPPRLCALMRLAHNKGGVDDALQEQGTTEKVRGAAGQRRDLPGNVRGVESRDRRQETSRESKTKGEAEAEKGQPKTQ